MVMYREVCPEGVQNKCPGGVWCRGFMSWGDTLILVISRGVQLYYGIAHCKPVFVVSQCFHYVSVPKCNSLQRFVHHSYVVIFTTTYSSNDVFEKNHGCYLL